MTAPGTPIPDAAPSAPPTAADGLRFLCRGCRYDLQGLSDDGHCPECGIAVAESRREWDALNRSRSGIAIAARGLDILAAALLVFAVLPILGWWIGEIVFFLVLLCLLVGSVGCIVVAAGVGRSGGAGRGASHLALAAFAGSVVTIVLAIVGAIAEVPLAAASATLIAIIVYSVGFAAAMISVHQMCREVLPAAARATLALLVAGIAAGPFGLGLLVAAIVLASIQFGGTASPVLEILVLGGYLVWAATLAVLVRRASKRIGVAVGGAWRQ